MKEVNENNKEAIMQSYLTFQLEKECFAVNVTKVIEILEVPTITNVPKAPPYMKGVINLRGNVLPVVETRIKFGLQSKEFDVNTCILVLSIDVEGEETNVGAIVDSVQEVLEIGGDQIKASPSIGTKYKTEFIKGMIENGEEFIMLIDIDKVFSTDDVSILMEVTEEN